MDRLHHEVYQCLQCLMSKFQEDLHNNVHVPGFIQSISIVPSTVHCWTETGVRLWHELNIDATGSVVKDIVGLPKLLYYELSCRSTCSGPSVPLACMLSSSQTAVDIVHFLQKFRNAERKIYGFQNLVISMTLITSLLSVYNGVKFDEYLQWCWEVVSGKATVRHFMRFKEEEKFINHVHINAIFTIG